MFERWGHTVVRIRWVLLAAALALVAVGATWGTGVFGALGSGGFNDTNSASNKVRGQIVATLGSQDGDVLALYSSTTLTVTDPAFRSTVTGALSRVSARPEVEAVITWYQTQAPTLVANDRHATYAVVRLRAGTDDQKLRDYRAIKSLFTADNGAVGTQLGGIRPFYDDANLMTSSDIARSESLSMPILLILLVLIFGSVVAAASPLVIGGIAILGAFVVTRLLTYVTDVSTFAINIITLIGLGLSIDYALFVVSRFREELAAGRDVGTAVARTMATAGRTVAVSGATVTLALASLLLFPQGFLKSMAYGGMSAVFVAMIASLTVLPAGLAVLGTRINAWRIPLPRRRAARAAGHEGGWARLAHSVMRRPWMYLVGVLIILGVLAAPVQHISFGGIDVRVLPRTTQSRVVNDRIAHEFPATSVSPVEVFVRGDADAVMAQVRGLPGVTGASVAAHQGTRTLIDVDYAGDAVGDQARLLVRDIRALTPPSGTTIGVTGATADLVDQLHGLGEKLPWMVLMVVTVTIVLLFLAFGSVVLPIKAVLMNAVSLGAAFGVVVFVFQDGHFASLLGFTSTGAIEPTNPILMVAVLFGLATDYEVFLLSRVREEWDRGADNTTAVASGLQRTGRIITSAALLLIIVVVGFATGQIGFVKLIGVGMIVAIAVDATLVRALLVPATMRLIGRWNWWAPGPLRKIYRRYGLSEGQPAPEAAPVSSPSEAVGAA